MSTATARPRRKLVLGAVGLILVVGALAAGWDAAGRPGTTAEGGPIEGLGRVGGSHPIRVGKTAFSGLLMIENTSDEPVVLESVRPLDKPDGLTILHTYAVGPDREYEGLAGSDSWPQPLEYPAEVLEPIDGFSVPPANQKTQWDGTGIVFVFRAERPGEYGWRLVEVKYRAGKRKYRRVVGIVDRVCTRPDSDKDPAPCAGEIDLPSDEEIAAG